MQKKDWNTKSTESLAQNHFAFDLVGGWRQTPNEGMAACRWICPEIVGPESSRPASGEGKWQDSRASA